MLTLVIVAALIVVGLVAAAIWTWLRRDDLRSLSVRGNLGDIARLPSRLRRVARDPRTPRRARWWLVGIALYLVSPIDLIPDFIPVLGQLDDLVVVSLALRHVQRMIPREVWRDSFAEDRAPGERHSEI